MSSSVHCLATCPLRKYPVAKTLSFEEVEKIYKRYAVKSEDWVFDWKIVNQCWAIYAPYSAATYHLHYVAASQRFRNGSCAINAPVIIDSTFITCRCFKRK